MAVPTTSFYGTSDLCSWILDKFAQLESNRSEFETKWEANEEAFKSELTSSWRQNEGTGWRAATVSNMVRNKVIGALAIMMDTAMSGGRVPFMVAPVDVPPGMEQEAQQRSANMERYMRWQQEITNEDRELRRCALSGFIYGMGWNRREVRNAVVRNPRAIPLGYAPGSMGEMRWSYQSEKQGIPASFTPSIWNMFWDYEERDSENMDTIIERDFISVGVLRGLMENTAAGYLPLAIKSVLDEHPREVTWAGSGRVPQGTMPTDAGQSKEEPRRNFFPQKTHSIRRLKVWTHAPRPFVEAFETQMQLGEFGNPTRIAIDDPGDDVTVMAEIAGCEIIRFQRVEWHERQHDFWMAEETLDEVGARGIADNAAESWKEETGYLRAALDNGNLAGNVIFTMLRHLIRDDGKELKIYPGCVIEGNEQCDDVRQAMGTLVIPDVTQPLLQGQKNAKDRGDEDSGVPRLIQGMPAIGSQATATEINELSQRGMQTFGLFMRNFDDGRIEPMEQWRLEYNMDDPVCADKWGPFKIQALGFSSFQGRIVRFAKLSQIFQLIMADPTGELRKMHHLDTIMEEIWKEIDIDPEEVMKTPEEMEADRMRDLQMQMAVMAQGTGAGPGEGDQTGPTQEAPPEAPAAQVLPMQGGM